MIYISQNDINNMISNNRIILIRYIYIYDVTDFNDHPGSYKCLVNKCGKNVKYDFDFHSYDAKKLWKKYCIGTIQKQELCIIM
jgi:cytochrome b involved in lipid metabolism